MPEWAESWWALITIVRAASGSPISQTTLEAVRFGSGARRRRWWGGKSEAMPAAPRAPRAAPTARRPRSAAIPPSAPSAVPSPSGHQ
jgi:hypothetical protein